MSERTTRILSGIISLTLIMGLVYFGVKVRAAGALRPVYQLNGLFSSAGQGLQSQSDVKIHGINIGHVRNVKLKDGRALVRMDIDKGEHVPAGSKATIRPKTLFGEKFVDIDPGPAETTGPFLHDEDYVKDTVGGFELEKILSDLYPILQAVKPEELATIIGTLADGAEGEGPAINRQIGNFAALAELQARHDADTRLFLDDLARLSDELANRSGDLLGAARNLNVALPPINQRSDELAALLDQAARLSTDLSDLLDAHQPLLAKAATQGGKALQVIYDRRPQIRPLLDGLRIFFQVLAEVGHIDKGDGTKYAGVKFIIGEECPGGRVEPCGENPGSTNTTTTAPNPAARARPLLPGPQAPGLELPFAGTPLPAPQSGADGVTSLIGSLLQ
ncbi:MAG TPA: MlaD family protein [Acidimicrobiales bacterium]|jgi:phospholipid/cholesterol/gamma-HCH transport system substrate-binding protein|nr:MlaD family protein [Acidimicrobiales bacterium]